LITKVTKTVERNVTILYQIQTLPGGGEMSCFIELNT